MTRAILMKSLPGTVLCCFFLAVISLSTAQPCEPNHQLCSPAGTISNNSPVDGSSNGTILVEFYEDLVNSVNEQPSKRQEPAEYLELGASSVNLCCAADTQCLLLEKFLVPFCWDRFTTNFFLPDHSYGNIASGNYTLASGEVNLITGKYTNLSSHTTESMYGVSEALNTATLSIPTPWTSKGVGSAIPANEVGETSNLTASFSTPTRTISLLSNSTSASPGSTVDTASYSTTTTAASAGGSTAGVLLDLLLLTCTMALMYLG